MLLKIWVSKSHVKASNILKDWKGKKSIGEWTKIYLFSYYMCSFLVLHCEPDLEALLGSSPGLHCGCSGFSMSPLCQARETQKKLQKADKSHGPAAHPGSIHMHFSRSPAAHLGGGCWAGLLTLTHMQILQLKPKSPPENLNERDATQSLYPVQVFVIRTTRSFYNHNMQCNAVGFY